jgi:hypothetical protein
MEVLSEAFPGRWMSRGGSALWPRRSPDLTQIYFLFRAYVKNYVYMEEIRDVNHLKPGKREVAE